MSEIDPLICPVTGTLHTPVADPEGMHCGAWCGFSVRWGDVPITDDEMDAARDRVRTRLVDQGVLVEKLPAASSSASSLRHH